MKKIFGALLALVSSVAFSATLVPIQLLNPTGSSSGQAIVSTGASSAPAWGGIGLNGIASIAANTVLANATASSAAPTAFAMPNCSAAGDALTYTSGTGFVCGTAFATSGTNSNITSLTGLTTPLSIAQGGTSTNTAQGSGSVVLATSPTITTPLLTGVTNAACASAGNVGQCQNSNVGSGSGVSVTTATATNVTSVALSAGNWLCYGNVGFTPAGTTVVTNEQAFISTTSATNSTPTNSGALTVLNLNGTGPAAQNVLPAGFIMLNLGSSATAYLETYAVFTTSTLTAYGYINCIRIH